MSQMTSGRSMFTEAIEDHLTLKKQNAHLQAAMPITRFDVGDPLDRYPGGPVRPATGAEAAAAAAATAGGSEALVLDAALSAPVVTTPQSDAPASHGQASVVEGEFRRPLEPLGAMTPMLSLVEDLDEDEDSTSLGLPPMVSSTESVSSSTTAILPPLGETAKQRGSVVRFPGGAGPRDEVAVEQDAMMVEDTGEQPVIVIDADEPLSTGAAEHADRDRSSGNRRRRPSFFNFRKKKGQADDSPQGSGWFEQAPRDFDWE